MDLLTELAILVLAAFVGFEVISKVPNTLHTPLMSGTNAIHGIVVLGGLLLIGPAHGFLNDLLLVIAIAFGTINVVGGFLVTDRMLEMFKAKPKDAVDLADQDQPTEHDDAVDGVRAAHQRRVQRVRHLRDHLEADERRQHEDRELSEQVHPPPPWRARGRSRRRA